MEEIHPELPVEVIRIDVQDPVRGLLDKARMFERSPFRETLFLDVDTVVLGRLDFGFRKAREFGLACCICECPWASRYTGIEGDLVEYNTGVVFFTERARALFEMWVRLTPQIDSSIVFMSPVGELLRMPFADQGSFAAAVEQSGFHPFVLPLNWNFRPQWHLSFFGPVKIWHDYTDVPPFFNQLTKYYGQRDSIIQYHAAKRT